MLGSCSNASHLFAIASGLTWLRDLAVLFIVCMEVFVGQSSVCGIAAPALLVLVGAQPAIQGHAYGGRVCIQQLEWQTSAVATPSRGAELSTASCLMTMLLSACFTVGLQPSAFKMFDPHEFNSLHFVML